jgi:hypothetical protein
MSPLVCCICSRDITELSYYDEHHLVPKSCGGRYGDKITIHRICHDKIHSIWTENELASWYHTVERILSHTDMQKFCKWIGKKPPEFFTKTKRQKR